MPRYILCPTKVRGKFILHPTDCGDSLKRINLNSELFDGEQIFSRVTDKAKLMKLLYRVIEKTDISRTKEGLVSNKNCRILLSYDDALADACNGRFDEAYEKLYCILRKYGITF